MTTKNELVSIFGEECVKEIGGWLYCVAADKYYEENWGIDIYNDYGEYVCSLLHKSFESFADDADMAKYVNDYIEECIY